MNTRLTFASLLLACVSFGLFLVRISYPPVYVVDECNYIPAAKAMLAGKADSAPQHPPLAKVIIACGIRLAGDNPLGWRLASAFFGSITLVAIFLWTYILVRDFGLAIFAAILTLFNNFLYVMARVAMLDVFYFAFVLLGVLAFTRVLRAPHLGLFTRRALIICSGLMFGAAIACKWNGLVFLACIALLSAVLLLFNANELRGLGVASLFTGFILVPFATYFFVFAVTSGSLHLPFSPREFVAANLSMWKWHKAAPGNPGFNVRWYEWFFRASPERGLLYLMGNFVVMWTGIGSLILCGWNLWTHRLQAIGEAMVLLLYSANILQWLVIPQKSTCYYYYYPSAMLLGVAITLVLSRTPRPSIAGVRMSIVLTLAAFLFFLYCYPHMTGLQAPFDCALGCWP